MNKSKLPQSYTPHEIDLNQYHYYEIYDDNKNYTHETFLYDYCHGLLTYRYCYINMNEKEYIYVEEELSKEDLAILEPFCQCIKCQSSWYHLSRYITCGCCIGCLKSPFPQQYQIDKARLAMNKEN